MRIDLQQMLRQLKLDPQEYAHKYPHQLSGGMQQHYPVRPVHGMAACCESLLQGQPGGAQPAPATAAPAPAPAPAPTPEPEPEPEPELADVELTETVPDNTTFLAKDSTPGWVCSPDGSAGSTCTFDVGTVIGGDSGLVFFAVTVDNPYLGAATQVSNSAQLDGSNAPAPA